MAHTNKNNYSMRCSFTMRNQTHDFPLIELRCTFHSDLLTTFTNHCYLVNGIFN